MYKFVILQVLLLLVVLEPIFAEPTGPGDVFQQCSDDELALYAELSMTCELPKCLREKATAYITSVVEKYPEESEARIGIQFAACECSCEAERCEVKQIAESNLLTVPCKVALLKKCSLNDERLTERCTTLTTEFPDVYSATVDKDPLGFTQRCQSCSSELSNIESQSIQPIHGADVEASFVELEGSVSHSSNDGEKDSDNDNDGEDSGDKDRYDDEGGAHHLRCLTAVLTSLLLSGTAYWF